MATISGSSHTSSATAIGDSCEEVGLGFLEDANEDFWDLTTELGDPNNMDGKEDLTSQDCMETMRRLASLLKCRPIKSTRCMPTDPEIL